MGITPPKGVKRGGRGGKRLGEMGYKVGENKREPIINLPRVLSNLRGETSL